jgi:hypothetical protein
MRIRPPRLLPPKFSRQAISIVTLFAYTAMVFGVPLPATARKANDQPFPCQNNPCGCATAEQCWRSCCCTTPEQRFAWAQRHGVTPPAYAERPKAKLKRDCCEHQQTPTDCQDGSCSTKPKSESPPDEQGEPKTIHFVLGIAATKCGGGPSLWLSAGLAPPPSLWFVWRDFPQPRDWVGVSSLKAVCRSSLPALPPPRHVSA